MGPVHVVVPDARAQAFQVFSPVLLGELASH
jgi:hypothetical protein